MPSFRGTTRQGIDAQYVAATDLTRPTETIPLEWSQPWAAGIGNNQANRFWSDSRSAAASADALDLAGGLTDAFGNTITFAKVREIWIRNNDAANALTLAGDFIQKAVMTGWVDDAVGIVIGPGSQERRTNPIDGWVVGASQDALTLDPGANTIAYDIVLIGTE